MNKRAIASLISIVPVLLAGAVVVSHVHSQPSMPDIPFETRANAFPQVLKAPRPAWVADEAKKAFNNQDNPKSPLYFSKFHSHVRFMPDGDVQHYFEFIIKGNEAAALQNEGRQGLGFNPAYQKLVLHFFGVHRDGQALDLKDRLQPQFQPLQGDLPGIYLGAMQALFELPDVRPTDTLVLAFSVVGANPVFGGKPWATQIWDSQMPTLERVHEMSWHNSLPARTEVLASAGANRWKDGEKSNTERTTQGEWTTVRHRTLNLVRAEWDERSAPGDVLTDVLQASVFQNWGEVRGWAQALFDAAPAPQSDAFQSVLSELKQLPTQAQQATAALRWVQREIRYVSLSLGENSHKPFAPDEVLARRFGDCKDKTLLLVHLLKGLGIQAEPALMSLQNPQLPSKALASPGVFDHAVATVHINGRMEVFDATLEEQVASWEYLTPWHAGADLLVLDGGRSAGFVSAPAAAAKGNNRTHIIETLRVNEQGRKGELEIEMVFEGAAADQHRWWIAHEGVETAKRTYLEDLRQGYSDAEWAVEPEMVDEAETNRLLLWGRFTVGQPLKRLPGNRWRHHYPVSELIAELPTDGGTGRLVALGLNAYKPEVVLTRRLELPVGWTIAEEEFAETISDPAFDVRVQRERLSPNVMQDRWHLQMRADRVAVPALRAYLAAVKQVQDMPTDMELRAPVSAR
jgi:hypothetical protein